MSITNIPSDIICYEILKYLDNDLLQIIKIDRYFYVNVKKYLKRYYNTEYIQDKCCNLCLADKGFLNFRVHIPLDVLSKAHEILTLNNIDYTERILVCNNCTYAICNDYKLCTNNRFLRIDCNYFLFIVYHSGLKKNCYQYLLTKCNHDSILKYLQNIF